MKKKKDSEIVEKALQENQTEEKITTKAYPVEQLSKIWFEIEPELILTENKKSIYLYGSKNLTKMLTFLKDTKVSKEDIDYWTDFQRFPVSRNTDERYEDYKIRQKFQNALIKYKKEVRAFSIMYTLQNFIDTQKSKKETEIIKEIKSQNKKAKEKL